MGIRSERRLCEEVNLNLAYRRFCRLDLGGAVPDHSTFYKNRHGRFRDSPLLCNLFEIAAGRCMAAGLVGGEGVALDTSLIRADVHRQRSLPGGEYQLPKIKRAHTEQMAASYNPTTYPAKLGGKDQKKLALLFISEVNGQAKELTAADHNILASVEIQPNFTETNKSYLVGIAFMGSPAPLVTEALKLSSREDCGAGFCCDRELHRHHSISGLSFDRLRFWHFPC